MKIGWKIIALEAVWRCWATESVINFRAARRSSAEVKIVVVRGGMSARGSGLKESSEESGKLEFERGEGEGGGRVPEEDGLRRGVEVLEDMAEEVGGGRTRLARRKVKNAAFGELSVEISA